MTGPVTDGQSSRLRPYPWQEESWQRLLQAFAGERLAHALLFTGTAGSGRRRFADAAARYLLCASPEPQGNCGVCRSCTLAQQGTHADLFTLSPASPGKRIGVDAIRDLLAFMAKTSALGARKVVLVTALDAFTTSAFNAFLKGLEEPADDAYLLLVAARGQQLPATIRSRCQRLPLPAPELPAARQLLEAERGAAADEQQQAAAIRLLDYMPEQPLAALELAREDLAVPLLALHEALAEPGGNSARAAQSAAKVPEKLLLSALRRQLRERARRAAQAGERLQLQRSLQASDRIGTLQDALRAGSNPSADLLRSSALRAWSDVG